jgi:hypothetical protein
VLVASIHNFVLAGAWGEILTVAAQARGIAGLVIDGAAEGTFELSAARLTDEPYRAAEPLVLKIADVKSWNVGKDPAVTAENAIQMEKQRRLTGAVGTDDS